MSNPVHGKSGTPEHNIWKTMKQRCYNKNLPSFQRYGARGIVMDERWKNSFVDFLNDMGNRPSHNHSIERIDNNCGYFKWNCRWATMKEQCNNRSNSVLITLNGETKTMSYWCEYFNIKLSTVYSRINRNKDWGYEKIFSMPLVINKEKGERFVYNGEESNLAGWAKKLKINVETLRQRINRGYSIKDAFTKKSDKRRL